MHVKVKSWQLHCSQVTDIQEIGPKVLFYFLVTSDNQLYLHRWLEPVGTELIKFKNYFDPLKY